MDWGTVREQLEGILSISVDTVRWPVSDWDHASEASGEPVSSVIKNGRVYWLVQKQESEALLFAVDEQVVSDVERRLVDLVLSTKKEPEPKPARMPTEEERKAGLVRDWLHQQQERGFTQAEMPDQLVSLLSLYSTKVPILLYGDYTTSRRVHYAELKKLLDSFFDAEITLIPLTEKEWLILGSEKILTMDGGDDRISDEETLEDKLAAMGYGLHEMLENEWVGEAHLAVHYPMTPAKSLYSVVLQLRETIMLGRTYHVGSSMHLPWELQLEKLVHLVPEAEKASFLERVLKRLDVAFDPETMTTLEQFFQLDCNVSETAKKLYIHRNTLLYRLDKFKQETGLDVRTFNNAVLVKIAMLLYKVTKRK
ncbi:YxkF [Paenibacillus mucilaginosus 3016]|uniref:YxkF n=1 Tax=Paenibacillus mucilaginosus 3016 TaxID=1116391 RepID=H6NTK4_9BACL|nr:helix-turn-helix domain-containing protein [Paenibacillus mucilaginosus]AFC27151.1 YxkF [Paenibacillus mucilaginosus 3016]WFA22429.1 PucR family transcriptional regulator [Paenibacillus mucilaginosus]